MLPTETNSRLRLAPSGIAALVSLFPTLLYLVIVNVPGLETVARKPDIFNYGTRLFGGLQLTFFITLCFVMVLIWRPKKIDRLGVVE